MLGSRSWRAGLVALASLLVASGSPARAQSSALTVRQSLAELVEDAELIVRGHVISARVEPHPQFKNLDTVSASCNNGNQNPIVFDADGSLTTALGMGKGVVGFASPCKLDSTGGYIVSNCARVATSTGWPRLSKMGPA